MLAWFKTIFGGFIAGVGGGAIIMIGDPRHFNLQHAQEMLWPCIGFGIIGASLLAKGSPFAKKDDDEVSKETLQRYQGRDKDRN